MTLRTALKVQLPLIEADAPKPPGPRSDCYVVLAWFAPGCGFWHLYSEEWLTREAADKHANSLPAGYTYKRIVRIPGEGQT